jgi:hypothetical protein
MDNMHKMAWTHDSENPQIRNGKVSPTPNVTRIGQVVIGTMST